MPRLHSKERPVVTDLTLITPLYYSQSVPRVLKFYKLLPLALKKAEGESNRKGAFK